MIVCHSRRFVYVKPGKTAGTSVELSLSGLLDTGDLVTTLRPVDERLRPPTRADIAAPVFRHRTSGETIHIKNHASYESALRVFGDRIADYTVMTTERNPWEKAISSFYWKGGGKADMSDARRFNTFVEKGRAPHNTWFYSLYGAPVADAVIRVEAIAEDYGAFVRSIGAVPEDHPLIREAKAGRRPPEATIERMYERAETRAFVAGQFSDLLCFLPYGYDDRTAPDFAPHADRRALRDRFLNENDCGPEYWERTGG